MEPLEVFDATNNKFINVYVTHEVAERCRTDNVFAQDLFNKLQDQDIDEGSAIEIETIKVEDVDESVTEEERTDKETWSRRETLKLIKAYQMYKDKFKEYSQKKTVWSMIAAELIQRNVYKSAEKCAEKWKNLIRTYKSASGRPSTPTRFQFFQEMKSIFDNTEVVLSDTDSNDELEPKYRPTVPFKEENVEKESWSKYETLKMLKAFQKHKDLKQNFVKEKQFWAVVSAELKKDDIHKLPEKCATKWKNLFRSYKKNIEKPNTPTRFQYFQEVCDVMNNTELVIPENLANLSDDVDFEKILDPEQFKCFLEKSSLDFKPKEHVVSWSQDETLKLIKAYKKHKHRFKKCPTKKYVWAIIASELGKQGIHRDLEKCENKWKSLMRSYRRGSESGEFQRFNFYEEIADILNDDGTPNEGEVSTTQDDVSLTYNNDAYLDNYYSIGKTEATENDGVEDGENMPYEEIIIETETDHPSETDDGKHWSYNETSALLKAYASCHIKFKDAKKKVEMWEEISRELESLNIHKTSESCEKKWRGMFNVYRAHKLNKTGPGKFSFYKEMDEILKEQSDANKADFDEDVTPNKKCKCMEKRMVEKQQRHIERMQLLKRKLDLEERKVVAFEFYVRNLKSKSS